MVIATAREKNAMEIPWPREQKTKTSKTNVRDNLRGPRAQKNEVNQNKR
jgi:hypothetical protein